MSLNRNKPNPQERRMSSIAKKLHDQVVLQKMGLFFTANIFLFVSVVVAYIAEAERTSIGRLVLCRRYITTRGEGLSNIVYVVQDGKKILLEKNINHAIIYGLILVIIAIVFQFLNLVLAYYGEYRRIKKTLKPINDMAIRVDELSRLSFDESKFHIVENAIENISPAQTTQLSLGDSDLQGIEAAMNNMLKRMHETYMQQARFVNDASHELRTPIAVIQGYANMLDRWGKEDEEILDESITAIKNESDHMNHLVEQLLFLARGDAGKTTMTFENVILNDVMNEIYEESLMIDENHIYKFEEREKDIHVKADPGMLKQAMRILVDNAAKYTGKGDDIILSVGTQEGKAYIQVQDTGIGMAEADVKHMFERFYRADDTRKVQGTGLGLSIAGWIVEKHGGYFEILSRKDLGTRIKILLERVS